MRLILYTRVSSTEQATEGVSLDAQDERMKAWCSMMGHTPTVVIQDAGVSGSVPPAERPGFKEVIKGLHYKQADGVVISALDRVGRSVIDVLTLITDFDKKGWRIFSLRESLDTSTAVGKFTVTILAAVAELERGMISQRTKEGVAQLKRQGKRYSRSIPWGKQLGENDMLVDCPVEQEVVARLSGWIIEGTRNKVEIARRLNEWHYHPRMKKPWTEDMVTRMFSIMKRQGKKPNVPIIRHDCKGKQPGKKKPPPTEPRVLVFGEAS